jgi:hypothetical protein
MPPPRRPEVRGQIHLRRLRLRIPGHDRPGEELRTEVMQVDDSPLVWGVKARCGFATSFAYHSED